MGYIEQENCVRLCNDLARMLEEEKTVLSGFLSGDIAEEYKKLLDSEIEEWVRLKKNHRYHLIFYFYIQGGNRNG